MLAVLTYGNSRGFLIGLAFLARGRQSAFKSSQEARFCGCRLASSGDDGSIHGAMITFFGHFLLFPEHQVHWPSSLRVTLASALPRAKVMESASSIAISLL